MWNPEFPSVSAIQKRQYFVSPFIILENKIYITFIIIEATAEVYKCKSDIQKCEKNTH